MKHIRPYQLFERLTPDQREVHYHIPEMRGTESLTIFALDTLILVSLARIHKVRSILELGTSWGYNAMQLSNNIPAAITTIDKEPKDHPVWPEGAPITPICADLNSELVLPDFDMVFCDCNYSPQLIEREAEIAFSVSPRAVAWHDYGNKDSPWVMDTLNKLSERYPLTHVEESWIVFWERP